MKALHSLSMLLGLIAISCGGGGQYGAYSKGSSTPASHGSGHTTASAPAGNAAAPAADSYGRADNGAAFESAPATTSSDSRAHYQRQRREQPQERPGLGTVFGETINSSASMKPFVRAASSPFAAIALHYNDEEGVRAHTGYLGRSQLAPFRTHTPHGGISVALTDEYGNLLRGGMAGNRALLVGQAGQRYKIVIQNHTAGRYEVVSSVDGLDVIDGRPADLAKRGYIIEPHSTLTIDGFRRSEHHVAAFRFGRVSQSYAARTSGDRNVGVIGIALFGERGSVWTSDELYRRDTANPFPGDQSYARPPSY